MKDKKRKRTFFTIVKYVRKKRKEKRWIYVCIWMCYKHDETCFILIALTTYNHFMILHHTFLSDDSYPFK